MYAIHSPKDLADVSQINTIINSSREYYSRPDISSQLNVVANQIIAVEMHQLTEADSCPISKLGLYQNRLPNIDPHKLRDLLRDQYYDADFMKIILCATDSIFYGDSTENNLISPN